MSEINQTFLHQKFKDWSQDVSALANPLILVLISFFILGNSTVFYQLLLLLLINEIICSSIKLFFHRKRPNTQSYNNLIEKIDAGSFPSIHSSRITITFLTFFLQTEGLVVKAMFILVIFMVMTSRIILKKHFLTDVLGGFTIGFLIWYFGMN